MKCTSEGLAVGLLGLALAVLACMAPAQSDTWWLLRAGHEIVSTLSIPLADTYSWTATGLFWPNHEWLTEVVFYLVHRAAGMPGLALVTAIAIVIAGVVSWRLSEGPFELRFVAFAVALAAVTSVFAIRPQVFTLAAFSLACLLLRFDRLWLLPLLVVAWVNFHGAAVLGLVAVVAAYLSDWLPAPDGARAPHRMRAFSVVVIACALATLASPLGIRLWTFIPESTERSRVNQLIEWSAPGLAPQYLPFWVAAAALLVLTLMRWRRLDRSRRRIVAVAIAVLPLAVQSMRNIPVFLIAALPAMTLLAAATRVSPAPVPAGAGARPRRGENERLNGAILIGLTALAGVLVVLMWMRPPPQLQWRPMSAAAARAIASCGAPLYNTYVRGGEIIWFVPEQKVFLDNRQDPYPPALLAAARKIEHDGDFRPVFDRYGIQCAAAPPESIVGRAVRAAADWQVAFEDRQWLVLTKVRAEPR